MFSSFFFGSEPHHDFKKNDDLSQGQSFLKYEDDVKRNTFKRLPFLELTSMPGLFSINEAFNGDDSLLAKNTVIKQDVSQHEQAFNKTLSEYSNLQQNLADSSLYHNTDKTSVNKIMTKLSELNANLIDYAKKINNDISQLSTDDSTLKKYVTDQQEKLAKYIAALDEQSQNMSGGKAYDARNPKVSAGVRGERNTNDPRTYNRNYYLMWFILGITIACLFMYILTSDLVMNTLVVIICLMIIYILAGSIKTTTF
jgi:hypothetical protein